jgi:hypothetical protein
MHRNVGVGKMWKKWKKRGGGWAFERDFQNGKTFKYYFQCRRADIFGVAGLVKIPCTSACSSGL